MAVPVYLIKAPPPWLHPPPVVVPKKSPPPKKAPPPVKAPPPAWLVPPAPWQSPESQSTASVVGTTPSSTTTSHHEVQSEETHAPSATTNEVQVLRQRVQTLEETVQHQTQILAILIAANAATPTPPPQPGTPPEAPAAAANAATPTDWTPPPPPGPPPEAPAAAAHGYNLPPPAGATRPLAICSTQGCDYIENIQGMELGFDGFCCWCCQQTSLNLRPYRQHGRMCQKHKLSWLW